jgi:hypothetical protein
VASALTGDLIVSRGRVRIESHRISSSNCLDESPLKAYSLTVEARKGCLAAQKGGCSAEALTLQKRFTGFFEIYFVCYQLLHIRAKSIGRAWVVTFDRERNASPENEGSDAEKRSS